MPIEKYIYWLPKEPKEKQVMRFGMGANRFGGLTGETIEIEEITLDKKSPYYYHVTYKPKGSENPFDLFTIRLLAKDELDAAKQVLEASKKEWRKRT